MGSEFLFGVPNSVGGWGSKKLRIMGLILTLCGVASLINGGVASAREAVKTYHLQEYTNTHWITSIFLFAGLSTMLLDILKINWYLYLTIGFCIVSIPVSIGAVVANSVNIHVLRQIPSDLLDSAKKWVYLSPETVGAMFSFAGWDLAYSLVAAVLCAQILREVSFFSSRYFGKVDGFRSIPLLATGTLMSVVGAIRVAFWIAEFVWLKDLGKSAQFLFLHYTMDEPIWNAVYCATGVLIVFVAYRGTRVLMFVSLGLTAITGYPALLYIWIDYRWYSNIKITEVTVSVPKPHTLLEWNIGLGAMHLVLIFVTLCIQLSLLRKAGHSYIYAVRLKTDASLRRAVGFAGLIFIFAGLAFLASDVTNLMAKSFYRVFYPTEQRAPFLLFATGLVTLFALRDYMSLYFLPLGFCLVLMTLHSTIFHITAFLFLAHQNYFNAFESELCSLFYFGHDACATRIERVGAISHFFEAAMAASLLMLALYTAVLFGRLMRLHHITLGQLGPTERRRRDISERFLTILGVLRITLGLVTVLVSVSESALAVTSPGFRRHPLILLHSYVYRSCLSLALLLYPVVQLVFTRNLAEHPLRAIALITISIMRFLDIITQMDYRNFSQSHSLGWTVFSVVELGALFLHFAVVCCCAALLDLSINQHLEPKFDFVDSEANVEDVEEAPAVPADPEPWSDAIDQSDGYRLVT